MLEFDPKKLEPMIVNEAVEQLLNDDDTLSERIWTKIDRKIDELFANRVEQIVNDEIQRITEAGFERTFQEHDQFGGKLGEPTSIRDRLIELVSNYWEARVDKTSGNPVKADRSYGSITRAQWVLVQALGEDFAKDFKQEAVSIGAEVKEGLRTSMRGWIDSELGNIFNIQTAVDKKERRRK